MEKDILESAAPVSEIAAENDAYENQERADANDCADETADFKREIKQIISDLAGKVTALEEKNARLSDNIEKLRDQMFTLGMAEVTQDGDTRYESYNNLILDEVCALRGDMDGLRAEAEKNNIAGALAAQTETLASKMNEIISSLDDVKTRLELTELKKDEPDAAETLQSKDNLTQSLDELKRELSKIAEDFSGK